MADHRPFPPSARRRALARAAGLSATSPIVVGAVAWIGAIVAIMVFGRAIAARLGAWLVAACSGGALSDAVGADAHAWSSATTDVLALVLPVLAGAALAALLAHVAQTRGFWLPRRSVRGAPALDTSRTPHAALGIIGAIAMGAVTFAWLWAAAPRLALLVQHPAAGALMLAGFLATLAAVWVVLGVLDALLRHAELARSQRMTAAEKREDERLAGADPRWRRQRAEAARGPSVRDAVAGASVVLLADGTAVAVAWDPRHRPIPVRTAIGRDARATQILGLARRHGIAVHRDPELALALADGDGPVPEAQWARLAEIIAATSRTRVV
jgi:flagellar biosynthesis protein FlhB